MELWEDQRKAREADGGGCPQQLHGGGTERAGRPGDQLPVLSVEESIVLYARFSSKDLLLAFTVCVEIRGHTVKVCILKIALLFGIIVPVARVYIGVVEVDVGTTEEAHGHLVLPPGLGVLLGHGHVVLVGLADLPVRPARVGEQRGRVRASEGVPLGLDAPQVRGHLAGEALTLAFGLALSGRLEAADQAVVEQRVGKLKGRIIEILGVEVQVALAPVLCLEPARPLLADALVGVGTGTLVSVGAGHAGWAAPSQRRVEVCRVVSCRVVAERARPAE